MRSNEIYEKTQDYELEQLSLVHNYPHEILAIPNPSEKLQITAVKKDWSVFEFLDHPTKTVVLTTILIMMKKMPDLSRDGRYTDADMFWEIYDEYHSRFPDWPEWTAIDKSLRTSGLIK